MSHRRSRSGSPPSYGTNSNDPRDLERRIFVGNLPTAHMAKKDMEDLFRPYGKIQALSLFRGYGFVQFERTEDAEAAKAGHNGRLYRGYKLDVNMAAERRQKPRSSPPRRPSGYGDSREPRLRSRSPVHGRDSRDNRDGRDVREPSREPRPGPPRDPDDERYRGTDGRVKETRDAAYRNDGFDRFLRGEYEPYRKKDEPYPDRYRENWTGRREPEEERMQPEERRRNELYRQYYEELQRRYDAERPVDCSVIVVNKQQKEYAEMVGRKVRDLGMVVDLIFLNTEVSLTQALEDVSRARTPFAIIITQQHEVHRSCTVNILFGTPQEHRNMPMQDAMVLVAHNYDTFKIENRAKERDEISRKAAKMADEVLMREHDRQGHPVSVLTAITLLSEGRFLSPQELTILINYLQDKRDRLIRGGTEPLLVSHQTSAAVTHETPQSTQAIGPVSHQTHPTTHSIHSSHLPAASATTTNQQQELQAKILSLFNSGSGSSVSQNQAAASQPQGYGSTQSSSLSSSSTLSNLAMSAHDTQDMMNPHMGIRPPANNRVAAPQGLQRAGTAINFDNPSVQKALDTLIQSGPAINQLVNSANLSARSGQGMNQGMNKGLSQGVGQGMNQGYNQGVGQGMSQGMSQGLGQGLNQGMGQGSHYQRHF
ncbi:nuclear receptor coactivator 5 isoform X1 [Tachysurus fulvidraco]|uniref:nuclear receptor coactivator 5 isoform X1 n=2 Tax=Tachysurus fulvidraco TaxID=1234273 RepID=UPI000F501866|nr:nuclear receptor coactivator 5 isoform X1 [Tachysurus fulvidraco]